MSTVKQAGTRLFYASATTAWAALSGGAAPSGWTEIANNISVDDVKPAAIQEFDDANLADTAPVPDQVVMPGEITFTKKKDNNSVTLRGLCRDVSSTKHAFVVRYADGTVEYVSSGIMYCTSGGKGQKADYQNKVPESYKIVSDAAIPLNAAP